MAKKKEPSIDDALNCFKDVMQRALLSNYVYVNSNLVSKNPKGNSILIIPEQALWLKIIEDEDLRKSMRELDISSKEDQDLNTFFQYIDKLKEVQWVDLNHEDLFKGLVINIKAISGADYEHPINKNMLPLKLKKSEYKDIDYSVFNGNGSIILALRKRFIFPDIPDSGFSIIRLFKVI